MKPLRILFTSHISFSKRLGATKVILELAEELTLIGWQCTFHGPVEMGCAQPFNGEQEKKFHFLLRDHMLRHAADYDVIEYDHQYLPFPRDQFPPRVLFVARSVLLAFHFEFTKIPRLNSVRALAGRLLHGRAERAGQMRRIGQTIETLRNADLVNIPCQYDRTELLNRGIPSDKIAVLPFGMGRDRRVLFDAVSSAVPSGAPIIAFVGTFDPRKGALEMPNIWAKIRRSVPAAHLRLIGTRGRVKTAEEVLDAFPLAFRPSVEVISEFDPVDLPALLAPCSLGLFPSYIEGFPNAVLEMIAASLPVIAYDAPGAPDMLPADWLVAVGDASGMASKVVDLLSGGAGRLNAMRGMALRRSHLFDWREIAERTNLRYRSALDALHGVSYDRVR